MPSIRKRYQGNGSAAPTVETVSPVDEAAQVAIEQKLEEQDQTASALKQQINALEKAESAQRLATEPPPPPQFPPAVEQWLSQHPEYTSDRIKNLELCLAHERAVRDGITRLDDDAYLPTIGPNASSATACLSRPACFCADLPQCSEHDHRATN
jgi:hypothetical protein